MYRKFFVDIYLKNKFPFDEAISEIDFALDVLFNFTYKDFIIGKTLEKWQISKLENVIDERIKTHKPIQQIIGQAYFFGRKFFVNESTLIPRPETEILVSKVLNIARNLQNPKILDIGTGSGCIPITLILENPKITAHCIDISLEALETAKKNAILHNVLNNITFFKSDLFENVHDKYNIIVSNPPYIPISKKNSLQIEVRCFEPDLALYTNDESGLEFFKKILDKSEKYLQTNGYIVLETGINQSNEVAELINQNGFSLTETVKDLNNIERVIICKK